MQVVHLLQDILLQTTDKTLIQDKRLYVDLKTNTIIRLNQTTQNTNTHKQLNTTLLVKIRML